MIKTTNNSSDSNQNRLNLTDVDYSGGGRYVVQTDHGDKYAFYIKNNGVYLDCSAKKVWVKHTFGIPLRLIHAIAKIVTTPLKMIVDIYKVYKKEIFVKEFGKRSFQHLTDFIRVPFQAKKSSLVGESQGCFLPTLRTEPI